MDEVLAKGNLDQIRNVPRRLRRDVRRRSSPTPSAARRIEAKIQAGYARAPAPSSASNCSCGSPQTALGAAGLPARPSSSSRSARRILDGAGGCPRSGSGSRRASRVARHRAGERDRSARETSTRLLAAYAYEREQIVDIYRAGALRAIAEAYQAMGDPPARSTSTARAVEEGVANPNSRPRAEDLVATCLSMAREPDRARRRALQARMREIRGWSGRPMVRARSARWAACAGASLCS